MCDKCLKWNEKEKKVVEERILKLPDNQIENLFDKVGIGFEGPIESIISEIKENNTDSMYLDILMSEADSKENLLKWINYFEEEK